jgi:hypothetical protein
MDPDDFIRRGYKGAKILKKLVNHYEVKPLEFVIFKSKFMFIAPLE